MEKYCIFHIPYHIDTENVSGSQIRPLRMIQAFEEIGYNVDVVMGYANERKPEIRRIKERIKNGVNYDFVYSESSTMPTLLTQQNHLPTHPLLDFGFLSFCKKNKIPVGLFYRDIYWRFPVYKEGVSGLKYVAAQAAYRYDLWKYEQILSTIFLPSDRMAKYLHKKRLVNISRPLPPGAVEDREFINFKTEQYRQRKKDQPLRLFYVGGVGKQYIFDKLTRIVAAEKNIELTICCRKAEWEKASSSYCKEPCDRIHIVHESGAALEKYYKQADICMAWFQTDEYRLMAMPVKIFEYLGKTIPVIATEGTAAGDFTKQNGTGWTIPYEDEAMTQLLNTLLDDPGLVLEKHLACQAQVRGQTWEARAQTVAEQLISHSNDGIVEKV